MSARLAIRSRHMFGDARLRVGVALLLVTITLLAVLGPLPALRSLLRGWLVTFVIFSSVPIGSMVLLLIHRLTGGAWGHASASVLRPAAAIIPLLALGLVPIIMQLPHLYPWAADPSAVPADVAHWYLNGPAFLIRSLIALAGWSCLALIFATGPGSQLLAGLGLAFFGLTISFIAVDWILSLEAHYVATAFAAMIAIQQILAALAFTAMVAYPQMMTSVLGDLGGLLIAALLGVVYLEFMTFVIAWYGDLPDKAHGFCGAPAQHGLGILVFALVVGALVPFGMLLSESIRRSRTRSAPRIGADPRGHHPAFLLADDSGLRRPGRRWSGRMHRPHFADDDRHSRGIAAVAIDGGTTCRLKK